jgi:glycosyltransferase involved in cell wall biosynthesis
MDDGQAAGVHVRELHDALERQGWRGRLVTRQDCSGRRPLAYLQVLLRALRLIWNVEVLYVRAHPMALPLLVLARVSGATTVVEVNGNTSDLTDVYPLLAPLKHVLGAVDRAVLRMACAVAAVSPGLAARVTADVRGRVPVTVVPNAADPRSFRSNVDGRVGLPAPYVAYCGALAPWQGLDTMLEAVTCAEWPRDVALVIAGGGPLRPQVVAAATAVGSPVHYLGILPHAEVPPVLAKSLAVVSVRTQAHASPVKLFEAFACGVPVIASAVPGQSELVELHGCGLLIPPSDAEGLARAVTLLAGRADLREKMAANAATASRGQDWDARATALIAVVEDLRQAEARPLLPWVGSA